MTRVSIVIPTYRESENLPVLIPRIHEAATRAGLDVEIIVVDDNSPDDTRAVCKNLAKRYPVRLLVREGVRGLSSAVIAGMTLARGEVLVVMDADLSHPPEKIPELVAALGDPDVDFVVGSRYVAGGSTGEEWGLYRWLNSKVATLLARPLTRVSDPMAGFFALRKERFEAVAGSLDPIGYKIGLELIVKTGSSRIVEVPIAFGARLHGKSKLSLKEQWNYVRHLRRLYTAKYGRRARLAQFVAVGASGMVLDLAAFGMLLALLPTATARALAIWIAMTWNFALNRSITFSRSRQQPWYVQYASYCASCLAGAAINWLVSIGLCHFVSFFEDRPVWAALMGVVAGTASNFLLCDTVVFRTGRSRQTPSPEREPEALVPSGNE